MTLSVILASAAVLIALAALAIPLHAIAVGRILVYGGSLLVAVVGLATALYALIGQIPTETLVLPVGLPWIGAHFRLDALSAFFLVVVNLGGAAASLYALGYGRHEKAPAARAAILPAVSRRHEPGRHRRRRLHLPVHLGVHVALLLGAGHGARSGQARTCAPATSICVMASFGTLALLLAFGLLGGPDGAYAFDAIRESQHILGARRARAHSRFDRHRLQGGSRAAACLAAARPPCGAEPCLRAAERAS